MFDLPIQLDEALKPKECVLMFSGGRDSTIAAIKLHEAGIRPMLVTVTSNHLFGYNAVEARLTELKNILPMDIVHWNISQPQDLRVSQDFYFKTCLPCQHAYVVVAAMVAKMNGIKKIALGYSRYQDDWPEQTPLAKIALDEVLKDSDLELLLPAYVVESKDEVKAELERYGFSSLALEQKCSRQVNNIKLEVEHLKQQIEGWKSAIQGSILKMDEIELEIRSRRFLGSF